MSEERGNVGDDGRIDTDAGALKDLFLSVVEDHAGWYLNDVGMVGSPDHRRFIGHLGEFRLRWADRGHEAYTQHLVQLRELIARYRVPATLDARYLRDEYEKEVADVKVDLCGRIDAEIERSAPMQAPFEPIQWNGSVQQLGWVLRELIEKGWIGAPTHKSTTQKWKAGDLNASAVAKAMAPHFAGMNLASLEKQLKAEGGDVPADDVEGWEIPDRQK